MRFIFAALLVSFTAAPLPFVPTAPRFAPHLLALRPVTTAGDEDARTAAILKRQPSAQMATPALPARRRAASVRVVPRRRAGRAAVVTRAGTGDFPAWDAAADVAINVHAGIVSGAATAIPAGMAQHVFQLGDAAAAAADEIPGLQKGGWLGPITDFLEIILEVRARERRDEARRARPDPRGEAAPAHPPRRGDDEEGWRNTSSGHDTVTRTLTL